MLITEEYKQNLKDNIDLVELVKDEFAKLNLELKKIGSVWTAFCPKKENHKNNDSTPSFRVFFNNKDKTKSWACMGCHSGKKGVEGNVGSDQIAFIMWLHNKGYTDAILYLADKYGFPKPDSRYDALYAKNKAIALGCFANLKGEAYEYLINRGLTDTTIKRYCLGFDGQKIVYPLFDRYNNVLGFTRRWIHMPENCKDKYNNSPTSDIFKKKFYLYNINNLDKEYQYIYITEGAMDAVVPTQFGAKNVLATLGTAFTEEHAIVIKNLGLIPVLVFDGDEAGLKAIKKALVILKEVGVQARVLELPQDKDLCDIALEKKEKISLYLELNSMTYSQYLIKDIMSDYDSKLTELKLKTMPKIEELLKEVPNELEAKIVKEEIMTRMNLKL